MRATNEDHLGDALVAVTLAQTAVEFCIDDDFDTWYYKLQYCKARNLAHELSPNQDRTNDVLAMLDQLLVNPPDQMALHLGRSAKAHALKVLYKWTGDKSLVEEFTNSFFGINTCETEMAKTYVAQSCGESYSALFDRGGSDVKLAIAQGSFRAALQHFHNVHAPGTHPYESLLHGLYRSAAIRMFLITHGLPHIEAAKNSFRSALQLMGPASILRTKTIIGFVSSVQLSAMSQPQTNLRNARDLVVARGALKAEMKRSDTSTLHRRKFSYLFKRFIKLRWCLDCKARKQSPPPPPRMGTAKNSHSNFWRTLTS